VWALPEIAVQRAKPRWDAEKPMVFYK